MPVPWLSGAYVVPELAERETAFPFTLPFVRELDFTLEGHVAMRALAVVLTLSISGCQCLEPVDEDDAGTVIDSGVQDAGAQPECTQPSDCTGTPQLTRWCGVFGGDGGGVFSCVDNRCVAQCAEQGAQTCAQERGVECLKCPPTSACVAPECGGGFNAVFHVDAIACSRDAGVRDGDLIRQLPRDGGCSVPLSLERPTGDVFFGDLYFQGPRGLSARIEAMGGTCIVTDMPTGAPRMLFDCPSCQFLLGP